MTLIEKVKRIDSAAAKWLIDNVYPGRYGEGRSLTLAMNWGRTPQGREYWKDIHNKVINKEWKMNRNGANA